jgi:NDP-sugar pyrophosphorylase family protein
MKAMILAAGFGTRLFPLTIDRTKPAIPFLGKPLVGYVAEYLKKFGFDEIIVNLHHQPDSVISALGDGSEYGVRITYSREEPAILGTAGALDNVRDQLANETFLVINGKIITDIDLIKAIKFHRENGAVATMVLLPNVAGERFTIVKTENERVVGFGGFPEKNEHGENAPLMFTGIQILEPEVFDYIPRGVYSDIVPTFYLPAIADGKFIAAYVAEGRWYELSTIERYLDISLAMMSPKTVITGTGCEISEDTDVSNAVLWDNIRVLSGARLSKVVISDGVTIPENSIYENAAIVRADMLQRAVEIPEKAQKGYFEGDNYIVPLALA